MAYPHIFIPLYLVEITLLILLSFRILKSRIRPKRMGLVFLYFFFFLLVLVLPLSFIGDILKNKAPHVLSSFFIAGVFFAAFSEEIARFFILHHSRQDKTPVNAWEMGMVIALFETHKWLFYATPQNITEFGFWGVIGLFLFSSLTYITDLLGHTFFSYLQIRFLLERRGPSLKKFITFFLIVFLHTSFNATLYFVLKKTESIPF